MCLIYWITNKWQLQSNSKITCLWKCLHREHNVRHGPLVQNGINCAKFVYFT